MNNKKGISLIVLVITIVVMIILASTVLFFVNDTMNNANLSAFAMDIKNIEDLVHEYYLNNNELPIGDDYNEEYTKTKLLDFVSNGKEKLSDEITENKDDADNDRFYIVDLSKLSISSTKKGIQQGGDISDSYIVSKNSLNVYYLKGEKLRGKYYFSLTKELIGKTEIEQDNTIDSSDIEIKATTTSIMYKKSTNEITNNLTVEVKTTTTEGETLKYTLSGKDITSQITTNIVNISDIVLADEEIKTAFYNENNLNKVLNIQKIKNNEVIAETNIDLSNLDILSGGSITSNNVSHTKYDKFILANITGYNDLGGSGLKETRVLYTTKLDTNGNTVSYYDNIPGTITKEYIYSSGVKNEGMLVKLPIDVTGYSLVFVDNAGNISDVHTFTVTY